jgi:hypothetical protein
MPIHKVIVSIAASISSAALLSSLSLAAPDKNSSSKVVSELQPAIQKLDGADCPVYLPTWIPEKNKAKHSEALLNNDQLDFPHGYEVSLGLEEPITTACTTFYMHGGQGRVKGKHPVKLSDGRIGYLKHALIEWGKGNYKYGMGFIYAKTSDADMIKCANSVVLIPKSKQPAQASAKVVQH